MIKQLVSRVYRGIQQRALYAYQAVDFAFLSKNKDIIVFLIPGFETKSGGILSIYSFYYETKRFFQNRDVTVLMMSYPNSAKLSKYTWFNNDVFISPFDLLLKEKYKNHNLLLHIPEYHVKNFPSSLTGEQRSVLKSFDKLAINIMNQNIEYMPSLEQLADLKALTTDITCTTAHDSYTTEYYRDYYGLPLHKLSSWFDGQEIVVHPYERKEDIMIVSPDEQPQKQQILAKIAQELPGLKMVVIQNMQYEAYKLLEAKAKWSITFGEGLDGYVVGPVLRGGLGFAVYNEAFFTEQYRALPTIFTSYDTLAQNVVDFIRLNDNKAAYEAQLQQVYPVVSRQFNYADFKNNVSLFYDKQLTMP